MPLRHTVRMMGLICVLMLLGACSKNVTLYRQALKEYKQGEFETSLRSNVYSLQLKPTYAKAQDLIKKTYTTAIAGREKRIRNIQEAAQEDMWDQLTLEYIALIDLQSLVKPLDPLYNPKTGTQYNFTFEDYETKLAKSRNSAAEVHYTKGLALAQSSTNPDVQREAALQFKAAMSFIPNFEDSALQYEIARRKAIKRIAILEFEDKSGARSRYGSLIDLLTDSVISQLVQDKAVEEFIEIVTRDQMTALMQEQQFNPYGLIDAQTASTVGNMLGAHEIMTGKIIQINYIPPRVTSMEYKETKNIVIGTEKYIDDNGKEKTREVKGDVVCNYKRYTKTTSVKIIASFSMIEVQSGRVKLQDTVTAEYPWSDTWGRIVSGDERALSDVTMELVSRDEPFPPSEVDMVNYALSQLSTEIVSKVKYYVMNW